MWVAAVFQRRRASLRLRDGVRERSGFDGPLSSSEPSEREEGAGAVETLRAGSAPNDFIDSVTTEAIDDRRMLNGKPAEVTPVFNADPTFAAYLGGVLARALNGTGPALRDLKKQ